MQLDPIKDLAEDLWVMGALFLAFSDAGASIRPIMGVCVLPPHSDRGRSLGLRAGHRNSRCHNPAEPRGPPQRSTLKSRLRPAQIRERCDAFDLGRTTAPRSTKCPTQCSSVQYGTPVIRWEEGCAAGGRRLAARLREVAQPGRAPVRWNDATCRVTRCVGFVTATCRRSLVRIQSSRCSGPSTKGGITIVPVL